MFKLLLLCLLLNLAQSVLLPNPLPEQDQTWTVGKDCISYFHTGAPQIPTSVEFNNGNPTILSCLIHWEDRMISTDFPTKVNVKFPVSGHQGAPEITLYLLNEATYTSQCATPSFNCLLGLTGIQSTLKYSEVAIDHVTELNYDITSGFRKSYNERQLYQRILLTLTKPGNGHLVTLDVAGSQNLIFKAGVPAHHWPPTNCQEGYHNDQYWFFCPGADTGYAVILTTGVPSNAEAWRNVIDCPGCDEDLRQYAHIIGWDRIGHGRSKAMTDQWTAGIPQQADEFDNMMQFFESQFLNSSFKYYMFLHDRTSPGAKTWAVRPENRQRLRWMDSYEAWMFTDCSPQFEAMYLCSSLFGAPLPLNYDPSTGVGHTNRSVSSWLYPYGGAPHTNCDHDGLVLDFVDCTVDFSAGGCGECLHGDFLFFHNQTIYYDLSANGPRRCFEQYHHPITGVPMPATWLQTTAGVFFPQYTPYDDSTCSITPWFNTLTPETMVHRQMSADELFQYRKFFDPALYADAKAKQKTYMYEPAHVPYLNQRTLHYNLQVPVRNYMDQLISLQAGDFHHRVMVGYGPKNIVPLPDPAYTASHPNTEVLVIGPTNGHWWQESNPEELQFMMIDALKQCQA